MEELVSIENGKIDLLVGVRNINGMKQLGLFVISFAQCTNVMIITISLFRFYVVSNLKPTS